MQDKIKGIQDKILELENTDISHKELGDVGFQEAEEIKKSILQYLSKIVVDTNNFVDSVPNALLEALDQIPPTLKRISGVIDKVKEAVDVGIHSPDYPKSKQDLLAELKQETQRSIKLFFNLESHLRLTKIETALSQDGSLTHLKDSKAKAAEISKILEGLQDKIIRKGLEESERTFASLCSNHSTRERFWFIAAVVFSALLVILLTALFLSNPTLGSSYDIISFFGKRLLMISTVGAFLKICLTKYSSERNLHIIYAHRVTVLEQYENFEHGIPDGERAAKNQFRLEIAKYIFTDPQTGYIKDSKSGEVSLNPVINLAEKMASKTSGA